MMWRAAFLILIAVVWAMTAIVVKAACGDEAAFYLAYYTVCLLIGWNFPTSRRAG